MFIPLNKVHVFSKKQNMFILECSVNIFKKSFILCYHLGVSIFVYIFVMKVVAGFCCIILQPPLIFLTCKNVFETYNNKITGCGITSLFMAL